MPAFIDHTPDEIAWARTLYEDTAVSPHDVARILGISVNVFYRRVKAWGWRRRRLRVAEVDAAAREAARSRDAAAREVGERVLGEKLSALERAREAAIAQLDALRATQERVTHAAAASVDGERSARALGHLTRALLAIEKGAREEARARREEELARREAAARDVGHAMPGDPNYGEDLDALRDRLADRLARFRRQYDPPVVAGADGEPDAAGFGPDFGAGRAGRT